MKCEDCEKEIAIYHYCWECEDKLEKKNNWLIFWFTLILGCMALTMILALSGALDSGIDKMDFDKDKIASDYVKSYYKEFKDCVIEYDSCIGTSTSFCEEGANIYCGEVDSRDAMRSLKGEPTNVLIFEKGLTLDDIIEARLRNAGLK